MQAKALCMVRRYALYAEDMTSIYQNTPHLRYFQTCFLRGLPQLDPVMQAYADVLLKMCDSYDTPVANSILNSAFDFINYTYLEPRLDSLPVAYGAKRFPWFLRERTGVGIAFALMLFPKTVKLEIVDYIQAVPDMDFWMSVANDLISCVFSPMPDQCQIHPVHPKILIDSTKRNSLEKPQTMFMFVPARKERLPSKF